MTDWREVVDAQEGMVARRQLNALGIDSSGVRDQLSARRWAERSPRVVSTFTGELTWLQRAWLGVLHAGGASLVGGLSALAIHGLRHWHRDEITVLVDDERPFERVPGVRFFRTRRPFVLLRDHRRSLPIARVQPAALLFAGYDASRRTGDGLLAAVVQQRLATAESMLAEVNRMRPLSGAKRFRPLLSEIAGGAESLAEVDVGRMCDRFDLPRPARQRPRRDSAGRLRFTDCEWDLDDGRVLVLEVDGAFHMEVERWEADIARHRRLSNGQRTVVRCTAREVRDEPGPLARDLVGLGLSRLCA